MNTAFVRVRKYWVKSLINLSILFSLMIIASPVLAKPVFTVMVYSVGSNFDTTFAYNSATACVASIEESGGSDENVNIVLQTGGAKQWAYKKINPERVQRWFVVNKDIQLVDDSLGDVSMGDENTLADFVRWTVNNYPAEKYILIMQDHGGGMLGFGGDLRHPEKAMLDLPNIKNGLQKGLAGTGITLDLLGFDACLMGTAEVAESVKGSARYLLASEELETGMNWRYNEWLVWLKQNPQTDIPELGKFIADSYMNVDKNFHEGVKVTVALTDLTKISAVTQSVNELGLALNQSGTDEFNISQLARARSQAVSYCYIPDMKFDLVDLVDLCEKLPVKYSKQTTAIRQAVADAVIYNQQNMPGSNGLSIFFPLQSNSKKWLNYYQTIDYAPAYMQFVGKFGEQLFALDMKLTAAVDNSAINSNEQQGPPFELKIDKEYMAYVDTINSIIGARLAEDSNKLEVLSALDYGLNFDRQTGEAISNPQFKWFLLNNWNVAFDILDYRDDIMTVSIPIKINDQSASIEAAINLNQPVGEIVGVYSDDIIDGSVTRQIISVKQGDKITVMRKILNIQTKQSEIAEGSPFIVDDKLVFEAIPLPTGQYVFAFMVYDITGTANYSDFTDYSHASEDNAGLIYSYLVDADYRLDVKKVTAFLLIGDGNEGKYAVLSNLDHGIRYDERTGLVSTTPDFSQFSLLALPVVGEVMANDADGSYTTLVVFILNGRTVVAEVNVDNKHPIVNITEVYPIENNVPDRSHPIKITANDLVSPTICIYDSGTKTMTIEVLPPQLSPGGLLFVDFKPGAGRYKLGLAIELNDGQVIYSDLWDYFKI